MMCVNCELCLENGISIIRRSWVKSQRLGYIRLKDFGFIHKESRTQIRFPIINYQLSIINYQLPNRFPVFRISHRLVPLVFQQFRILEEAVVGDGAGKDVTVKAAEDAAAEEVVADECRQPM